MSPSGSGPSTKATAGLGRLAVLAVAVFVLTFSLVPAYRIACEKIFGIRLERTAAVSSAKTPVADRRIRVEFDGGVNSKLPWTFVPEQRVMEVVPGRLYEASYMATNTAERALVGSAVPSVAPAKASGYFSKTECFCFTAQTLEAGQQRQMPVRFIVDPDLPEGITTLTLSYTFFKNEALSDQLVAGAVQMRLQAAP